MESQGIALERIATVLMWLFGMNSIEAYLWKCLYIWIQQKPSGMKVWYYKEEVWYYKFISMAS